VLADVLGGLLRPEGPSRKRRGCRVPSLDGQRPPLQRARSAAKDGAPPGGLPGDGRSPAARRGCRCRWCRDGTNPRRPPVRR
jgi:hypothetical protein